MIRKSLWMIPVVLLYTALGSPTARADTIVQSGGIVTAIDGITIAGITYNVTFGTTDDTTFAGSINAASMRDALASDLFNAHIFTVNNNNIDLIGVDGGAAGIFTSGIPALPAGWQVTTTITPAQFSFFVFHGVAAYAEFAPTATPEPDTLTLTGIGLLGLLAVIRKRVALRHAQAT